MKYFTYLIYIIFWETLIFGGCGYVVFILGFTGWWFALALVLGGMAYSPLKWIHGIGEDS